MDDGAAMTVSAHPFRLVPFPILRRLGTVLLALAAGLHNAGCSTRFIRSRAEHRIEERLEDLIGPAARYKVRVRHTRDAEIVVGHIRRIEVDGWEVRVGHDLVLDSLHLELNNLRYHAPPNQTVTVGDSLLEIHLTEAALNQYLRHQHPDSPTEVRLNDGTVTIKGTMKLLGLPTPIESTGRVEIKDGTRLEYRADTVRLSVDPIPGIGPQYVEKRLNPLLDVGQLNLPLRLDTIAVEPGRLVVRGAAYLPAPARAR